MDKYKRLLGNTFIFTIAAFSSKFLTFIMMPFYTRVLNKHDFGIADILVQTCNFLIPFATVGINNAIIRFGLEKKTSKEGVFTIGLVTILAGFVVMICFEPLLSKVSMLKGYTIYLYMYVLASALHGLTSQFARAVGYVRFYAIDGIISTVLVIILNILLLSVFNCGVMGYIWSTIIADFVCALLVFFATKQKRFVNFKQVTRLLYLKMLSYCTPLIPNTLCTLVVSISNRYFIAYMISEAANGIYAVANKIPTILMIVANIFAEAWQISAVTEEEERERFFSKVCSVYQSIAFTTAAFLILTAQLSTKLLAAPEYYSAWQYIPILVMGATFSCIASFLSSIYMVKQKSIATLTTTLLAAILSLQLSVWLIPAWGIYGAAVSTLISYFTLFLIRAIHTREYVKIKWNVPRLILNIVLLSAEIFIMMSMPAGYLVYSVIITVIVACINFKDIMSTILLMLRRRRNFKEENQG